MLLAATLIATTCVALDPPGPDPTWNCWVFYAPKCCTLYQQATGTLWTTICDYPPPVDCPWQRTLDQNVTWMRRNSFGFQLSSIINDPVVGDSDCTFRVGVCDEWTGCTLDPPVTYSCPNKKDNNNGFPDCME